MNEKDKEKIFQFSFGLLLDFSPLISAISLVPSAYSAPDVEGAKVLFPSTKRCKIVGVSCQYWGDTRTENIPIANNIGNIQFNLMYNLLSTTGNRITTKVPDLINPASALYATTINYKNYEKIIVDNWSNNRDLSHLEIIANGLEFSSMTILNENGSFEFDGLTEFYQTVYYKEFEQEKTLSDPEFFNP